MAVPINLGFELGTEEAGQALGWTVEIVATATLYADYGRRVLFDATGAPDVNGEVVLPDWLTVTCSSAERSIQTSLLTFRSGFAINTARARSLDGTTWGLALENAISNLEDEQDLSAWNLINGATVASATGPNGVAGNIEATDPNGAGVSRLEHAITPGISAVPHTLSAWREILTAPTTDSRIEYIDADQDPTILSAAADAAFVFVSVTVSSIDDGTFTITPRATTAADTGATRWAGIQLEQSPYPTSFMGADNATFARSVDIAAVTDPTILAPGGFFTLRLTIVPHFSDSDLGAGEVHNILWFDDDNRIYWDRDSGQWVLRIDGTDLPTTGQTWSRNQELTITARHQPDGTAIIIAGATTGNETITGVAQAAIVLPALIYLGGTNVGTDHGSDVRVIEELQLTKQAVETFEAGWGNTPMLSTIPAAAIEFAGYSSPPLLSSEPFESFERGPFYLTEIGTKELATYGIGSTAQTVETFNEQWAETALVVTANAGADELTTASAHKLTVGRLVRFSTTGVLPAGLTSTDPFYVVTRTSETVFQVSATPAGPVLDITDAGTGTHTVHAGTQDVALTTIPPAELELAIYDAGGSDNAFETFEMADGWDATYVTTISSLDLADYTIGAGTTQAFEDFESVRFREVFGVLLVTNKLLVTGHPFSNGEIVKFVTEGRLPAGLNEKVIYFVRDATANDFEVELVSGSGTAVDITDTGVNASSVVADETRWFTLDLSPL